MNRATRRKPLQIEWARNNISHSADWPVAAEILNKAYHELDEDACCIHCGFDAAEEHHLRMSVPSYRRPPKPLWAIYCHKRS